MSRSIQYEDFALRIAFDKLQGLVVRVQSLHGASDTPMECPTMGPTWNGFWAL